MTESQNTDGRVAPLLNPPYYAVMFTSVHGADTEGYGAMADRMEELARLEPGFLGIESVRDSAGVGITISYWKDLDAVRRWKENTEHKDAQTQGKDRWYKEYKIRISRVEREYGSP